MARWLVQLSGDRLDLEDLYAIEENEQFFLVGPALEALSDAESVLQAASNALDRYSAIVSLLWRNLRKPLISHVWRETNTGQRHASVFVKGTLSARSRARAAGLSMVGGQVLAPQETQAQQMLRMSNGKPHLENALSLWGDPLRSWPRLYRILEELEAQLGKHVDESGWCPANERARFTRTANTAESAGMDARHAAGRCEPPQDPMSLHEAEEYIAGLMIRALR
jgi:hypothetical protein